MTVQQIVIRQYTVDRNRTPPLLQVQQSFNNRFAEVAGGTTAECAAVCCCCPFALVNLLIMAVYGVPAGLYRKALRKKQRRRLLKKGLLVNGGGDDADADGSSSHNRSSYDGAELLIHDAIRYSVTEVLMETPAERLMEEVDSDVIALENEMWKRFYGTGFWRSGSQRVD